MADHGWPMRSRVWPVVASRTRLSASASRCLALARTCTPAVVGVTLRLVRCSSRTPRTASSESRVRETAAWDTPRSMAASVKLPASTIAIRQRRCRSSRSMTLAYRRRHACILRINRPPAYSGHGDLPAPAATGGRPSFRRPGRALRPLRRSGHDARQRPVQPGWCGRRGAGLPGDRAGRGGGRPAVGGRGRAAGHRPPPGALVHLAAVVAGAVAGPGLRHHEPVAVHRDRPHRPRPGGDAGVPRAPLGRAGRLAPEGGPRLRAAGRGGRGRPGPPRADHRLPGHRPRAGGGRLLGLLHPAQPRDRPPPARREGPAAAAGLSGLLYVPIGIATLLRHPPTASALGYAAAAGILSSAVPFLTDLLVLRRVPARFFGVFMSVNPVLAALVGLVILDQTLRWAEWLAIAAIVSANTVSVLTAGRRGPPPP